MEMIDGAGDALESLNRDLLEMPELRYFVLDRPQPFRQRKTESINRKIWKRKYDIPNSPSSPTIDPSGPTKGSTVVALYDSALAQEIFGGSGAGTASNPDSRKNSAVLGVGDKTSGGLSEEVLQQKIQTLKEQKRTYFNQFKQLINQEVERKKKEPAAGGSPTAVESPTLPIVSVDDFDGLIRRQNFHSVSPEVKHSSVPSSKQPSPTREQFTGFSPHFTSGRLSYSGEGTTLATIASNSAIAAVSTTVNAASITASSTISSSVSSNTGPPRSPTARLPPPQSSFASSYPSHNSLQQSQSHHHAFSQSRQNQGQQPYGKYETPSVTTGNHYSQPGSGYRRSHILPPSYASGGSSTVSYNDYRSSGRGGGESYQHHQHQQQKYPHHHRYSPYQHPAHHRPGDPVSSSSPATSTNPRPQKSSGLRGYTGYESAAPPGSLSASSQPPPPSSRQRSSAPSSSSSSAYNVSVPGGGGGGGGGGTREDYHYPSSKDYRHPQSSATSYDYPPITSATGRQHHYPAAGGARTSMDYRSRDYGGTPYSQQSHPAAAPPPPPPPPPSSYRSSSSGGGGGPPAGRYYDGSYNRQLQPPPSSSSTSQSAGDQYRGNAGSAAPSSYRYGFGPSRETGHAAHSAVDGRYTQQQHNHHHHYQQSYRKPPHHPPRPGK